MQARKQRPGDHGGIWGKQSFGGYPGVKHTAKQIIEYIPIKKLYVEPFAGLGRTAEYITGKMVLNDMSDYAVNYLRKKFIKAVIYQKDFMEIINKFDHEDVIFFIDPPWKTNVYDENTLTFCDRKDIDYYRQLFTRFLDLKADWILASGVNDKIGKLMIKTAEENNWYIHKVESMRKVILGQKAKTLLMSNKPFEKHRAFSIGMDGFL